MRWSGLCVGRGRVLRILEGIQSAFNGALAGGKKVSLADVIVLAGCAGVEQAAKRVKRRLTPR